MYLAIISLLTALTISGVAIYYSVIGLTAIFAAAAIPIMVMGVALEVAKLVATLWLHKNWKKSPFFIRSYLTSAVIVLMFITSMGIFGFLSKAHMDQSLVSGDVQSKIAVYDEKIKIAKENIDANRKALKQMDEAVDQVMGRSSDEKGADKAVGLRRSQQKERARLQSEIASEQKAVAALSEERAPIAAEVRKVEAEVGPIKYIAAFVYGDNPDANILEKAVTWVIIIIVFVFDPLAVVLLLASQYSFKQYFFSQGYKLKDEPEEEVEVKSTLAEKLSAKIKSIRQYFSNSVDALKHSVKDPIEHKQEPVGIVAQEVAEVLPEAVVVEEEEKYTLDLADVKAKLSQFVDAVKPKEPELVFTKFDTPTAGFVVPKVSDAVVPTLLVNGALNAPAMKEHAAVEEDDLPVPIEQWNAMIAAAEEEVTKATDYPADPFVGQQFSINKKNYIYNGTSWIFTPVSGESKFQLLPELKEHIESRSYVQNEEQTESNLWQEARKNVELEETQSLSQEDYQDRVKRAIVNDLVNQINEGKITAFDLTDEEAKAVEEYLKAENDSQDNPSQSA
jgi:hypothetical protein